YRQALLDYLTPYREQLDADSQERLQRNPLRILDSKDPATQAIVRQAPKLLDHLSPQSLEHFQQVQSYLDKLAIPYEIDPKLVRGLDYYTHTAFEIQAVADLGSQNTVCGGGRYDGLAVELGGAPTPAVGWALGMERLVLLLQKRFGDPVLPGPRVYVVSRGEVTAAVSLQVAQSLWQAGIPAEVDLSGSAFGKQMKRASRKQALWAVIIGEEEVAAGVLQVKQLATGEQVRVAMADLVAYLGEQG
ncbi:MAG: histidine--tRNA ligase, partial [Thermostichales cyanobacterium BF3_bins_165]